MKTPTPDSTGVIIVITPYTANKKDNVKSINFLPMNATYSILPYNKSITFVEVNAGDTFELAFDMNVINNIPESPRLFCEIEKIG